MSLLSRLREKQTGKIETATPTTFATQEGVRGRTVANVATVNVAKPSQGETVPSIQVSPGDTAAVTRWWLIQYPDRDPLELAFYPEATYAEILEWHPEAIRAEPVRRDENRDSDPQADSVSLKWAELVGEDDPVAIGAFVRAVRFDPGARNWIMGQLIRSSGEQA
jgi:hypothetical protein